MKCNVGQTDRMLRIVMTLGIAGLGYYFRSWWGLLAIVPLATSIISFCPLYKILGISSCDAGNI